MGHSPSKKSSTDNGLQIKKLEFFPYVLNIFLLKGFACQKAQGRSGPYLACQQLLKAPLLMMFMLPNGFLQEEA
jgi:hypothetical protein